MSLTLRTALFGLYCFGVMVANGQVMRALLGFSQADPSASHLVLIPFVTLALILRRRDTIFSSSGTDWRAGVLVIAAGLFSLFVPSLLGQTGGQTDLLAAKVAAL